jgi:anion-transporting  ArsA/GET3 family ATPase
LNSQSKIVIFCGKGGVGKTSLSLAFGLSHAAQGRKVVVVTSHPLPELAVSVSLEGLSTEEPVAAKNLFVVHLDPKELLADVVRKNFPLEWVARAILNSQLYRNLIEVAPGLKEFYFLARLQQLAERKVSASGAEALNYELLLWDAPSTGHFLGTLHAAKNFETFLTGPLASAGADLARFFSNAEGITVLPTTTLEEMAIDETVEMCDRLEREFHLHSTLVLMNLVSPLATAEGTQIERLQSSAQSSNDAALRFAIERGLIERERTAQLTSKLNTPAFAIERARNWSTDLDLLRQLGQSLEKIPIAP